MRNKRIEVARKKNKQEKITYLFKKVEKCVLTAFVFSEQEEVQQPKGLGVR